MAMSYTSLTAAKGTPGAIATWVNYTKLDIGTVVDEAQALLYGEGRLRTREMKTSYDFTLAVNQAYLPLPTGFLDPIGDLQMATFNTRVKHKDAAYVKNNRNYTETLGTLGTDPFTTTTSSNTVSVNLPGHGFTQASVFYTTGAAAFNGATITGTFPINGITDANNFTIDISILGPTPSGSGSGGGAAVTYICDAIVPGTPLFWAIWDERVQFDQPAFQTTLCRLHYYQSLPLLAKTSNETNFLTNRYPKLMRVACLAAAAEFMKDDAEYQKYVTRLVQSIEAISMENDMHERGMELDPYIP
jgi:hypothetical protein